MYNKEELLSKSISELEDIAKELSITVKSDTTQEDLVYDIIEAQAIDYASKNPMGTKRKRTRIAKKDDHVYSVNGKEGENFDVKKNKPTAETTPLFKDIPEKPAEPTEPVAADEEPAKPAPKKRGRKSKAELAALAAEAELAAIAEAEAKAKAENAEVAEEKVQSEEQPAQESTEPTPDFIPEAEFASGGTQEESNEEQQDLFAQLQAKVNDHNKQTEGVREENENGIWSGDPGDGTDFITVVDLPIEDHAVLPNYDTFDNPTTPVNTPCAAGAQQG